MSAPVLGAPAGFDPRDPAVVDDPYPAYARLRSEAPVALLPGYGIWVVSRYADVTRVLREPRTFSSRVGMSRDFLGAPGTGIDYRVGARDVRVLIATDPPEHQVFRQAVAGTFAPAAIGAVRDRVVALARGRVAELVHRNESGRADFFADVAEPLPVLILADLLGVPAEMHDDFRAWSTTITADLEQGHRPAALGRGIEMFRYFSGQLRRRSPGARGTLLDSIASARGAGVTEHELLAFCAFLLVAGIETTTNLLTNLLAALLRFPEQQRRLREHPELVGSAIEEGLRYDTPVQALWRGSTRPVELAGQRIPAGARILVSFGSANRDERKFAEPDRFLIDRPRNDHLGFGAGPHYCLGARLARLEVSAALTELLAATRWIEAAGPVRRTPSLILRGLVRQPVRLEPR